MDILIVNSIHPYVQHVSATRAWRFAQELAAQGDRVVVLTAADPDAMLDAAAPTACDTDGWLRIIVAGARVAPDDRAGAGAWTGRIATALNLAWRGGNQWQWTRAAVRTLQAGIPDFSPDVVWTTFGQMESVFAARAIARHLHIPWVLDVKDDWQLFVPRGLRLLMAWRLRDADALTANSGHNRLRVRKWLRRDATIVYSGVDAAFHAEGPVPPAPNRLLLNLVGGLYFPDQVRVLVEGLRRWLDVSPATAPPVTLTYFGHDSAVFAAETAPLRGRLALRDPGYVPIDELARACRTAAANMYIAHGSFHHKLLELASCGRPMIAIPGDTGESRDLVSRMPAPFIEAGSVQAIMQTLDMIAARGFSSRPANGVHTLEDYSWRARACQLKEVLESARRSRQ